jgi:adenine specific DNA methylase Mod
MTTLNWRGKDAVLNHHLDVPYHLLKCRPELSTDGQGSGNLIVEGDNLLALKALLPYYKGQVKCIYIDPPYNTGKQIWIYNDNVNSNEMKEWFGQIVGPEAEDFDRHDKWLCMMWPRLTLLKEFLSQDGVIFISIDDNEIHNLIQISDNIFGIKNRMSILSWETDGNIDNQGKIKRRHEYVLVYAKSEPDTKHPKAVDVNVGERSKLNKDQIQNTIVKNGPRNPVSSIKLPVGFPASFEQGVVNLT